MSTTIGERTAVLESFSSEDETLSIKGYSLLVLYLAGLDVIDGVGGLDLESDRLACEGFDEHLHPSTETKDKMEGRLLLHVVVGQGASILKLLASEDRALSVVRGPTSTRDQLFLHETVSGRYKNLPFSYLESWP